MNTKFKSICVAMALVASPLTAQAFAITYDIGSGSAPGFSGSWLHAATSEMGTSGYFANGAKAGITGSLTLDMGDLSSAYGTLIGSGDLFGTGSETWVIDIVGGGSSALPTFVGGDSLLLSLDYTLTTSSGLYDSKGSFYFADFAFGGGADSPNLFTTDQLTLWGNNWINNGTDGPGNIALGIDLYSLSATEVPEPGVLALMAMGLIGFGVKRRIAKS